jgi:hypothetical protein
MSLTKTAWGDAITDVSTSASAPVGTLRDYVHPTYGPGVWRYVLNGEAANAFAAGLGVMAKDSVITGAGVISGAATPNCRMLGVAQHAIVKGSYGWILKSGFGLIQSNATQTINTAQKTAAAGQFTDGTIGADEMGAFAIGDDGGVAVNVTGRISF